MPPANPISLQFIDEDDRQSLGASMLLNLVQVQKWGVALGKTTDFELDWVSNKLKLTSGN